MNSSDPIRVMIVDDHPIVRQGFAGMLATEPNIVVVAEAANGQQAIDLFRQHRPDITLMDLRMPVVSGVEAITSIRKEFPKSRFIVLTTYDGDEDIYRALQSGAQGYLLKSMYCDEIIDAIRTVNEGRRYIPMPVATRLAERMAGSDLTSREIEVLELIVKGNSNKQIADVLAITEPTVKGHVSNILGKLGVGDRTQAATAAIQRGIIHLQ
jgi:two-component system NarL family response regulator